MVGDVQQGRLDAEGVMVGVRWLAVVFAIVQTSFDGAPFPAGVETWAWALNAVFALCAALITILWLRLFRTSDAASAARLGIFALTVDFVFASAVTWIYAYEVNSAIFVVLYIVAIEASFRYGIRGGLIVVALLAVSYTARDIWAANQWGLPLEASSISFRMGVAVLIASVAGAMSDRTWREHRRLLVALEAERSAAAALRSLDELRSTFLAAVSHELRTPLTSILGFALTIQGRSAELSAATRMMLDQVVDESRHLEQLLEDLLDIERMGRGSVRIHRVPTDVGAIADALAVRIERREGRPITVLAEPAASGALDAPKVERILDNLLGNAIKYSPEGSPISVRIGRLHEGVLIVVDDEGPGVPDAMRATIFAPFERGLLTSAHQPGTGIGLSLVDRFARLHGGHAWVEDRGEDVSGASFRVYLPDGPEGSTVATVVDEPWGAPETGPGLVPAT